MRLVLDTAIMVAALRSDAGASRLLLTYGLQRHASLRMLLSVPLLIEYEAVLTRPEHLRAARLSVQDVGDVLDAVAAIAEEVELDFLWRPAVADADDEMVLETAVNGRADGIVTFNIRDFAEVADRFGIAVMSPADALRKVERDQ